MLLKNLYWLVSLVVNFVTVHIQTGKYVILFIV